ncbi:MAG: protein kinase [Deltaproteobacteria bacterium]
MPQLGRYEILQRLARGSIADVLLARASGLEGFARHVVIKQIRPEHASDTRFVTAFLDEARIGASLHHQNIVQVFDIDQVGGSPYFAMEYVHGEDVRRVLAKVCSKDQLVPLEIVVAIGAAAAAGLHYAHEHHGPDRKPLHLVHRDVSPSNILIGYDGSVKLVDFGLAKPALRGSKTRTGALCKAPYMSPELAMGKHVDRRSDLFVLGTVLYELATARRLFKGENDYLTMAMIVEGNVPPPSTLRPDLPKDFDEIIMHALAKDPGARFQTGYDLRSALESFAIEHELRTSARAVADYLAKVFGHRPEPWHDKEAAAEPSEEADVDFDASTRGLVPTPSNATKLVDEAAVDAAAPIALAREVANGSTSDPETTTFDDDDNEPPTQFDIKPDQEETATGRGSAPKLSATEDSTATTATETRILADSTTTAAQPIVDVLATGQHATGPRGINPITAVTTVTRKTAPATSTSGDTTNTTAESTLDDTLAGGEPSSTVKTPSIAVPSSIPPRPLPRAGASPSSATTLPVRPAPGAASSPRIPAPPVLPSAPPPTPTRLDTDAGDEATTVEPPLFPMAEPVIDALPPEEVYIPPPPPHIRETELPQLKRWGLVGAVLLIPIVIGLLAYVIRDDAPPTRPVPAMIAP